MRMNVPQARAVLRSAGVAWQDYTTLKLLREKAYDPIIKTACDILLRFMLWDRKPNEFDFNLYNPKIGGDN